MDIDAVEQWTGDAGEIPLHSRIIAAAVVQRIAPIAAGTGIHGRGQYESGRKRDAHRRAAQRHRAVLERLPKHLKHIAAELG